MRYLEAFSEELSEGARVLEPGCGGGGPTTSHLAARFDLTGIHISERQVALSREPIPGAVFVQADMTRFHADPATFDGVAAFYSLIHLPLGELQPMLSRISSWLRPGGIVASFGARGAGEHLEVGWLAGTARYWSSCTTTETLRFVQDAGLKVTVQGCREQRRGWRTPPSSG